MKLRTAPRAVNSLEHLSAYIKRSNGKAFGEYRERFYDDGTGIDGDVLDCQSGSYYLSDDGSVVFEPEERNNSYSRYTHSESLGRPVSEADFASSAVGIVVKSRHKIPAPNPPSVC